MAHNSLRGLIALHEVDAVTLNHLPHKRIGHAEVLKRRTRSSDVVGG